MKLKLLLATSLFCASIAYGQQSGQNYVLNRTMLNSAGTDYVDNVQYYDGLGRPMQSLSKAVQASTVKERLATLLEYDNMGRVGNSWLPTPVTANYTEAASLKNLATAASGYGDTHPYGKNVYEASPLERLTSQYGAGAAWHNNSKAVNTAYLLNQASGNLSCKRYYISNNTLAGGGSSDVYAAGRLHVTQTTDEDGKVSYTFTDLLGNTVLVRQVNGSELLDTYYVYDNYNNLRYVLQPMYQSEANLAKYAFQYEYDYRNRCVKKRLPGADYISYVYDDADLLIYSQDGNQRAVSTTASAQKWTYYKYDGMRRLTEQGECTGQSNTTNAVVHIKNYYDSYSFIGSTGFTSSNYTAGNSYGKGYLTGSEVTVLGSSSKIYKAFYYDQKGREVKRVQNNLLSGYDVTSTTYSFSDKLQTVTHTHTASGKSTRTETVTYNYDYADRLSSITHKLGTGTAVTLVSYTYDTKGRLSSQKLHGSQTQSYTYNVRNWLTNTSNSKFSQNLYYNSGNGTAYYNGNISSMTWLSGSETTTRGYKFSYDGANRLLNGAYGEGSAISSNSGRFSESAAYDKNGNITSLQRYGQTGASAYGLVDNLSYTLNGNQLSSVTDAVSTAAYGSNTAFSGTSSSYAYDKNGNLTKDSGKGISNITYNVLNLPQVITFSDGSTITYTYTADGTKLRTVHVISGTTTQTDYCGNVIYESGAQKYLLNEVGYYNLASSVYCYYLKDHQGNNRVVINSSGTVLETNHYYPFGGLFASSTTQPFKYNGKEFDNKKGLNWYDYGARHYDAVLGRFTTQDRYAEKYSPLSLYQYGANNPVRNIDVNGDSIAVITIEKREHLALLVQNKEQKWEYYSVNGNNVYVSGKFLGGRKTDDLGSSSFNSPTEFLESSFNSKGEDASVNGYDYSDAYIIPTTLKQDEIIKETFTNISKNEEYHLLENNCATVVQRAMNAAGLKVTNKQIFYFPKHSYLAPNVMMKLSRNPFPSATFKEIMRRNPNGIHIRKNN